MPALNYFAEKCIFADFDSNLHYRSRWVKNRKILRTATLKR